MGCIILPAKDQTPLVIHAKVMKTCIAALQCLQTISRWRTQVLQAMGSAQYIKFTQCRGKYVGWITSYSARLAPVIKIFGCHIAKGYNHTTNSSISRYPCKHVNCFVAL